MYRNVYSSSTNRLKAVFIILVTALITNLFANNQEIAPFSAFSLNDTTPQELPTDVIVSHQTSDSLVTIELLLKMNSGVYMYATEENFFKLDIAGTHVGTPTISYPRSEEIINYDNKPVGIYRNGQKITATIPVLSDEWQIEGTIRYQACDSIQCFLPQTVSFNFPRANQSEEITAVLPAESDDASGTVIEQLQEFATIGSEGGFLKSEAFLAFLNNPVGEEKNAFADKSIVAVILLILIGGVALNLTPCILPMIPITLAIIGAGSQARSRSHGFLVGGVYGSAMAFTYGILGVVVVLTGTQFGTLNANPIFNFAIAGLFVILALAMFDVIHIDLTKYRNGIGHGTSPKGQLAPVFFMGIVAALLAGACVAPVVISVVLYSATLYGEGVIAGLLLPFLLGIGMALPWPFAGAGISVMPKPGNWMIAVRNIFGIFILATALYYGYSGIKTVQALQDAKTISDSKGDIPSKIVWNYSLEEALAESKRTNTPVVIDFWATWCKNCTVMEKTTFQDNAVAAKMNSYIPVKFQAENPRDPAIKEILDHFNIVGLPSYVILEPRSESVMNREENPSTSVQ